VTFLPRVKTELQYSLWSNHFYFHSFIFEAGSPCVAQAALELEILLLCLLSAGIIDVHHHIRLFLKNLCDMAFLVRLIYFFS
jgi:hypothetical protein